MMINTSNQVTVLVVEDNLDLLEFFSLNLELAGYDVITARHGLEAQEKIRLLKPDLVVLDLGLPLMDGFGVLQWLREFSDLPVIILTAWDDDDNVVRAFETGIDDYIVKPVSNRVLLARVKAVVGPGEAHVTRQICRCGDLVVDFESHEVYVSGTPVHLTRTEFRLLKALAENLDCVVEHHELVRIVWGRERTEDAALQQADRRLLITTISRLRQSIEPDPKNPTYIITEQGVGYRLRQH